MYASARDANSIPLPTARRNAAIPKVCTDIQIFDARDARLSCRPQSE
ncbi:MAG: hypothetical protein OXF11_16600 [Deltaproteobacteria bacterium]|nr:hypothetical protein [Deltaproteobacteria bacterium]